MAFAVGEKVVFTLPWPKDPEENLNTPRDIWEKFSTIPMIVCLPPSGYPPTVIGRVTVQRPDLDISFVWYVHERYLQPLDRTPVVVFEAEGAPS